MRAKFEMTYEFMQFAASGHCMKNSAIKVFMLAAISLVALPALAKESPAKAPRPIDVSCIQSIIDIRDSSLANMVGSWASSVKDALETRRSSLKDSWAITDYKERRFAQRKAWSDYGKILRGANDEKKKIRARIWKTFDNDRRKCEGAYSPEMKTGSTYDANL
ncbi:MAG: hypothetical protein ABIN99_14550 [Nitrosospira sp.]